MWRLENSYLDPWLLLAPQHPPEQFLQLFDNFSFKKAIRVYNNVFTITSIGASKTITLNVDDRVKRDGVYIFRVQGIGCHRMGSLLTSSNRRNTFAQVHINDPDMTARVESRMIMTDGLDVRILETIDHVMVTHNDDIMVQQAGDRYQEALVEYSRRVDAVESSENNPALRLNDFLPKNIDLRLRLHVTRHSIAGTHNTPTASEIAAISSSSYDPLQHPLPSPYGERGWTYDLPYVDNHVSNIGEPKAMSFREYEAYLLYDRITSDSLILRAGRLTQQYCVDQWAKLEPARLRCIEINQLQYRLETLQGLADALHNESVEVYRVAAHEEVRQRRASTRQSSCSGDQSSQIETAEIGRKIIIPLHSPVDLGTCTIDSWTLWLSLERLGLQVCLSPWHVTPIYPQIKENLWRGQKAYDQPDIVARDFMQNLKELNKDERVLGIQAARVHVVEYQKCGLPHAHILLILRPEDKPVNAEDVDNLVWAKLPDKDKYPELYETVISRMMHGLCGEQNPRSPCMKNGRCSKKFPKPFSKETTMSEMPLKDVHIALAGSSVQR
ncbi:Helitron helicase [Phytophthora megakarya]|uniref:Helitron helicase n=1 Tax=Phytophthora megakarya TaxID=4795 RepID=A0A225VW74_9STRA|nr:Helitron helicase [Phytophthora megakarya]